MTVPAVDPAQVVVAYLLVRRAIARLFAQLVGGSPELDAVDNARLYVEAQRAIRARDQLLAIRTGRLALERASTDLAPLIIDVVEAQRVLAEDRRIAFTLPLEAPG